MITRHYSLLVRNFYVHTIQYGYFWFLSLQQMPGRHPLSVSGLVCVPFFIHRLFMQTHLGIISRDESFFSSQEVQLQVDISFMKRKFMLSFQSDRRRAPPLSALSQLPSVQNNPIPKWHFFIPFNTFYNQCPCASCRYSLGKSSFRFQVLAFFILFFIDFGEREERRGRKRERERVSTLIG